MSDQQPPDRASSDPSKQAAWGTVSENDLDAVLSHAASLAAELSEQIQSADDPAPSSGPASGGNPLDSASTGLDAELEQLEQLIDTAAAQMQSGGNADSVPSTTPEEPVPDFMTEFTSPHKPGAPSAPIAFTTTVGDDLMTAPVNAPPDRSISAAATAKPGVVGSGMMGVVGGAVNISPLVVPRPGEPLASAECERESETERAIRLFAPLLVILHGLASLLELMNRPLARVGDNVRRLAGWIAIALIAASVMVFVRSIG